MGSLMNITEIVTGIKILEIRFASVLISRTRYSNNFVRACFFLYIYSAIVTVLKELKL